MTTTKMGWKAFGIIVLVLIVIGAAMNTTDVPWIIEGVLLGLLVFAPIPAVIALIAVTNRRIKKTQN